MSSVDQRVVELAFENDDFERGIKKSMDSLDEFDKKLDFQNSTRGFGKLASAVRDVDFSSMTNGIMTVQKSFSALEIAAYSAINNITNRFVNAGIRIAKNLTIGQVMSGFNKYTEKTEAVQTISAAMPEKSLESIYKTMEKLMWYSDETSYSFTEMSNAVAKFVANGVDLDKAAQQMQGVANWAAASGVNPSRASGAFYNLSQAMGMGYLGTADFRSIELLNMATAQFKEMAVSIAEKMGTITEEGLNEEGKMQYRSKANANSKTEHLFTAEQMRSFLSEKWFDSDVMQAVFGKYGKYTDQVKDLADATGILGWQAEELLAAYADGGQEQFLKTAKELEINEGLLNKKLKDNEYILDSNEWQTHKMVQILEKGTETIDGVTLSVEDAQKIVDAYGESGYDAAIKVADGFGVTREQMGLITQYLDRQNDEVGRTGYELASKSKTFRDAMDAAKDAVSTKWSVIFENIFGKLDEAINFWSDFGDMILDIFTFGLPSLGSITEGFSSEDFQISIGFDDEGVEQFMTGRDLLIEALNNVYKNFINIRGVAVDAWNDIFYPGMDEEEILTARTKALVNFANNVKNVTDKLKLSEDELQNLRSTFGGVLAIFDMAGKIFSRIFNFILPGFSTGRKMGDAILSLTANFGKTLQDIDANFDSTIDGIIEGINNFLKALHLPTLDGFRDKILGLSDVFINFTDYLKLLKDGILNFFGDVAQRLGSSFTAITEFFGRMFAAKEKEDSFSPDEKSISMWERLVQIFQSLGGWVSEKGALVWTWLQNTLGKAKDYLDTLDMEKIAANFKAITSGLLGLVSIKGVSNLSKLFGNAAKQIDPNKFNLMEFTKSIPLFEKLKKALPTELNLNIPGLKDTLNALTGQLKAMQAQINVETIGKIADAIIKIAGAIFIVALIDPSRVLQVVGVLGAITGVLIGMMDFLSKVPSTSPVGGGKKSLVDNVLDRILPESTGAFAKLGAIANSMLEMAAAVYIIGLAVSKLASIPEEDLARSVIAISTLMGVMAVFAVLVQKTFAAGSAKKNEQGAESASKVMLSMLGMALAVRSLAISVAILSFIDPQRMWNSVGAIAALVGVMGLLSVALSRIESGKKALAGAAALAAIALAIVPMMLAFAVMSLGDPTNMLYATMEIGILVTVFAALVSSLAKIKSGPKAIAGAMALGMVATSIVPMMLSLAVLTLVDPTRLMYTVSEIGILVTVFGTIVSLLGKLDSGGKAVLGAVALSAIALAIVPMMLAFVAMAKADPTSMLYVTMEIATLISVFGVVVSILGSMKSVTKALLGAVGISAIALALVPMLFAIKAMAKEDPTNMLYSTMEVSMLLVAFATAIDILGAMKSPFKALIGAVALGAVANMLIPLLFAIREMSKENPATMLGSVVEVGVLALVFASVVSILAGMKSSMKAIAGAKALEKVTQALIPMIAAMTSLSLRSITGIGASTISILLLIAGLMLCVDALTSIKSPMKAVVGAVALAAVAASLAPMIESISLLARRNVAGIGASTISILLLIGGLMICVEALSTIQSPLKALVNAKALGAVAESLAPLITAMAVLSTMGVDKIAASTIAIVALVGMLTLCTTALSNIKGGGNVFGAIATMASLAVVINLLIPPLQLLGKLSFGQIIVGIVGIAGALGVLVGAAVLITTLNLSNALVKLGESVRRLGIGMLGIGVGTLALVAAILLISKLGEQGATIMDGVTAIIQGACAAINNNVALVAYTAINLVFQVILGVLTALINNAMILVSGIAQVFLIILNSLASWLPVLASACVRFIAILISSIAEGIIENGGMILAAIGDLAIAVYILILDALQAIVRQIPIFGNDMAEGLEAAKVEAESRLSENTQAGIGFVDNISQNMLSQAPVLQTTAESLSNSTIEPFTKNIKPDSGFNLGGDYVGGVADGMTSEQSNLFDVSQSTVDGSLDIFNANLDLYTLAGTDMSGEVNTGFETEGAEFPGIVENTLNGGLLKIDNMMPLFNGRGSTIASNIFQGYTTTAQQHSPSRKAAELAKFTLLGFLNKFDESQAEVAEAGSETADSLFDGLKNGLAMANMQADLFNSQPVIKPMMDLSEIQNGVSTINDLIPEGSSYGVGFHASYAQRRAAELQNVSSGVVSQIVSGVSSAIQDTMSAINEDNKNITVNVVIEPDSAGLFRVVRAEANKFVRSTGYSPFNK